MDRDKKQLESLRTKEEQLESLRQIAERFRDLREGRLRVENRYVDDPEFGQFSIERVELVKDESGIWQEKSEDKGSERQ